MMIKAVDKTVHVNSYLRVFFFKKICIEIAKGWWPSSRSQMWEQNQTEVAESKMQSVIFTACTEYFCRTLFPVIGSFQRFQKQGIFEVTAG